MSKIKTWIKIENHFIDQDNVQALRRHGAGTLICRIIGEDIIVNTEYEKVKELMPPRR